MANKEVTGASIWTGLGQSTFIKGHRHEKGEIRNIANQRVDIDRYQYVFSQWFVEHKAVLGNKGLPIPKPNFLYFLWTNWFCCVD